MLGMTRGLVLHNAMQLSIPFWVAAFALFKMPDLDFYFAGAAAVIGSLFPDVDHFSMWGRVKHRGFFDFIKFCVKADRYRKAFLPFHNYIAMFVVAIAAAIFSLVNVYATIFFAAFFVHLMFDFVADLYLIKQHTHWKLRNWFDANNSGFSAAQQVQQGNKQKHHSRKPRRRR